MIVSSNLFFVSLVVDDEDNDECDDVLVSNKVLLLISLVLFVDVVVLRHQSKLVLVGVL